MFSDLLYDSDFSLDLFQFFLRLERFHALHGRALAVHDESAQAENPVDDLAEEYASVEVDVLGLVGAVLHAFMDFKFVKQLALGLLNGAIEFASLDVAVSKEWFNNFNP